MSTFQKAPFLVFCLVAVLCGGVMIGTQQGPGTGSDRGGLTASSAIVTGEGSSATPATAEPRDILRADAPVVREAGSRGRGQTVSAEPSSAPASPSAVTSEPLLAEPSDLPSVQPPQQPAQLHQVLTPGTLSEPATGSSPARPTRGPEPTGASSQDGSQTSDPAGSGSTGGASDLPTTDFGSAGPTTAPTETPSTTPSPGNPVDPTGGQTPGPGLIPDATTPAQPVVPESTTSGTGQPLVPEQPADPSPAPDEAGTGHPDLTVGSDPA